MDSSLPSSRVLDVQQLNVWKTDASLGGHKPGDQKASPAAPVTDTPAISPAQAPAKLQVTIDPESGRFVQTLLDPETKEVLAMYPTQGQLAFSRAISAYLRARRDA